MKIAIAGATGLTGSLCLQHLLQNDRVSMIIAIGRKATAVHHAKLSQVLLENNRLACPVKVDAFISCLGSTIKKAGTREAFQAIDYALPVYLAEELQKEGCKSMAIISALGAATTSRSFYLQTKGKLENDLNAMSFESLSILRPSFIVGKRTAERPGENIALLLLKLLHPFLIGGAGKFSAIEADLVARALVNAVVNPKEGMHIYFYDQIKKQSVL
jgi:uncharacterized protein YbjT (DUF2867 family)